MKDVVALAALLATPLGAAELPAREPLPIEVRYIGGPTVTITLAGVTFIVDPTFDAAGREYPLGAVTLRKQRGPAIGVDELGRIDVALVSHDQHPDNLDDAGRALLGRVPRVLTTISGAHRLGSGAIGLAPWQSAAVLGRDGVTLRVTATPARHGPVGIERIVGDVVGFVITEVGAEQDSVYVTGDTVWYEGTAEVARRFNPRVVLLFGGAASTRGPFHLTMDTNDAVETAVAFKDATIVPVHHDGWAHFKQTQQDIANTFEALGLRNRLHLVEAGRALTIR